MSLVAETSYSTLIMSGCVLIAVMLDRLLGEPKRWHPLVGFGYLASRLEARLNRAHNTRTIAFLCGFFAWVMAVMIPVLIIVVLLAYLNAFLVYDDGVERYIRGGIDVVILYLAIGHQSLRQHAQAVLTPLQHGDLQQAQRQVAMIVSRDSDTLDEPGVRKAAIESVLENGSDAIFAPIFWFIIGGAPAVLVYRFSNTLDAMWGYKTERFLWFGCFAARMDDLLNWLPSRLVGVSYTLLGNTKTAWQCWQQQAHLLESPSAGVVMAAGAGALNVRLGGDSVYHGQRKVKPVFGAGRDPENHDLHNSLRLVGKTLVLWCTVLLLIALITDGVL